MLNNTYQRIAFVSHELRTPLNGILGFSYLLQDLLPAGEHREMISTVVSAAEYMERLIGRLLEHASHETAPIIEDPVRWTPSVLARECVTLFRESATAKGIALTLECGPDTAFPTLGHPDLVRQVLLNLLTNAVDFTEQGRVTLRCCVPRGGNTLEFTVTDTGPGIPAERASRIFAQFYHSDSAGMTGKPRTGLGLAISHAIARRLGGDLTYEPRAGGGSVFCFKVPPDRAGNWHLPTLGSASVQQA